MLCILNYNDYLFYLPHAGITWVCHGTRWREECWTTSWGICFFNIINSHFLFILKLYNLGMEKGKLRICKWIMWNWYWFDKDMKYKALALFILILTYMFVSIQ